METQLAIVIGCLYGAGIYMMLRRSLFKLILGLVLLSHGANLLIFTAAGLTRARPPIVGSTPVAGAPGSPSRIADASGAPTPAADAAGSLADPLPQALILTAIVIGFGVLAFALVLFHRTHQTLGSDDPDELKES